MAYNYNESDDSLSKGSNYNRAGEATALAIISGIIALVISIALEVQTNKNGKREDNNNKPQEKGMGSVEMAEKE